MALVERHREMQKRADRRAGGVIAALYNVHTRTEETDPIRDWWDFFPEWKEEPEEQTEEEMLAVMQMFATKSNEGLSH